MLKLLLFPLRVLKYRTRDAIIIDILTSLKKKREAKKTQIMQSANLNYAQTKRYLSHLIDCGFIMLTERRTYIITERGSSYLRTVEIQKIQSLR